MDILKQRIASEGQILPGNIIKVDSFLNHKIDVTMLNTIGQAFYERFKDLQIDKIITIEASGIAIAVITAQYFNVPVIFAKKGEAKAMLDQVYATKIHSYTKDTTVQINIAQAYLLKDEQILILDDFLAHGEAVNGLIDLISQAKAKIAGIGIVIEKGFQDGGSSLRAQGHRLESLVIIDGFDETGFNFRE